MSRYNLSLKPLAPKPLAPKPTPTFFSQNQRNFEREIDPNLLVKYRAIRPTIQPNSYHNSNTYHKESIRVDDNLMDLTVTREDANEQSSGRKRKITEVIETQTAERWSDEETDKLLSYLEENYEKLQQGKKAAIYNSISTEVIKVKSSASIKGRIKRLLEKYEKIKKENDQTGSRRNDWKWFDRMDKIFGCQENINPSFVTNDFTGYISDEEVEKRQKNSVESLVDVINNINQSELRISEQRLKLEREKMQNEYKLQTEKLEVEKQKWEYEREQLRLLHELSMKKIELQLQLAIQYNNNVTN
ncbi:hypothetical protein RclHR1_05200009 [Rhizophagus clarus]|uniref:Zinc finger and SCAN domain-containing protein 29-like n=1 Tax=Rhizophagus clarus TaxID=94130 RepID=A0A2Z6RL00_9GLOM|nr:hypothetical protein RclHR1_05200009 [Rhizophagus clarus]GES91323.1 zinc finger and SCAN domain-containing protein 29-like [Rhizophagus clarus]